MLYTFTSKVQLFTPGITDKCSNSITGILNINTQFNCSYSSDCLQNTLACVLCTIHAATMWTHHGVINFFQNNGNHLQNRTALWFIIPGRIIYTTKTCTSYEIHEFVGEFNTDTSDIIVIYVLWNPRCHAEFERRHFDRQSDCAMACNSRCEQDLQQKHRARHLVPFPSQNVGRINLQAFANREANHPWAMGQETSGIQ